MEVSDKYRVYTTINPWFTRPRQAIVDFVDLDSLRITTVQIASVALEKPRRVSSPELSQSSPIAKQRIVVLSHFTTLFL